MASKIIIILVIMATCCLAHAESNYHDPVLRVFDRFSNILPAKLAEVWKEKSPELNVIAKPDVPGCVRYRRVVKDPSDPASDIDQYLDVSRKCLAEVISVPAEFSMTDVNQSKLLKSLYRFVIELWSRQIGSIVKERKIRKEIYGNHYFLTPIDLSVDVTGSMDSAMISFWTETTLAYMTNPDFMNVHPDAYQLLRDNFFDGAEYFAHSAPVPNRRSEEIHPTLAKVKFLQKGNEAWYMRYQLIKNAKKTIYAEYYILEDDVFGQSFVALLLQAMQRGVHVKFMTDGKGSLSTSRGRLARLLRARGAETVSYNPIFLGIRNMTKFFEVGLFTAFVAANHAKILLVDDNQLITGGRNIGGDYFLLSREAKRRTFVDADIYAEFKEPFVAGIAAFNTEFYSEHSFAVGTPSAQELADTEKTVMQSLAAIEDRMQNRDLSAATIASHPEMKNYPSLSGYNNYDFSPSSEYYKVTCMDKTSVLLDQNNFSEPLYDLIRHSSQIVMQNPYISLPHNMRQALIYAANNNSAQISLSTTSPSTTDVRLVQSVFAHEWKNMMRDIPNLKIYAYVGAGLLHSKIFVFNGDKTLISSYNLDRLPELNSEFGLLVESKEFAKTVTEAVTKTITDHSKAFDLASDDEPDIDGSRQHEDRHDFSWLVHLLFGKFL